MFLVGLLCAQFLVTVSGYFNVEYDKGKDFSFTCPFDVEDTDILIIARTDITNYFIDGNSKTETAKAVYNTSSGGLGVGFQETGRYTALKDEKNYYTIYISKVVPEDSGTWTCEVKKIGGTHLHGSYEKLTVLGANVETTLSRMAEDGKVAQNFTDGAEISIAASKLTSLAYFITVDGLMAVPPDASVAAHYEDGSSENLTSKFFHSTHNEFHFLQSGMVASYTIESFLGNVSSIRPGVAAVDPTKGQVLLATMYKFADTTINKTLTLNILDSPIMNPDRGPRTHSVYGGTAWVTCYVVANPRVTSVTFERPGRRPIQFRNVNNINVNTVDNVTLSIVKAEADRPSNWYNLTIKYKPEETEYGFDVHSIISVYNDIGFHNYSFYLLEMSGSSIVKSSIVLLLAAYIVCLSLLH